MDRKQIFSNVDSNRRHYAHETSLLKEIDVANQSWHMGAASERGSPLHSLGVINKDPILVYPATWVIVDMYDYNFKTGQWAYLPD
jgi:hypothetical protein